MSVLRIYTLLVVLCVVTSSAAPALAGPAELGGPPQAVTAAVLADQGPLADADGFEENDDPENATAIQPGTYEGLDVSGDDPDYYAVTVPAPRVITVTVEFNPFGELVWLGQFLPSGATVSRTSSTGTVRWVILAPTAGTYYPVVDSGAGVAVTTYDLSVAVEEIPVLEPGIHRDLAVRDGDPDFYAVEVPAGHELVVRTTTDAGTDLSVSQYGADGRYLSGASVDGTSTTRRPVFVNGTNFLRVDTDDSSATYDLFVSLVPIPPIQPGSYDGLVHVPGSLDMSFVELASGEELTVTSAMTDAGGAGSPSFALRLYDSNGSLVAGNGTSELAPATTSVYHRADDAGRYYVRVVSFSATGPLTYDLSVVTDRFEENDDRFEPASLAPGRYDDLFVAPDDADWYAIDVPDGGTLTADVLFAHADADVDARLYDEAGTLVDSSTSTTDNESVAGTDLAGGTYLLRVHAFGSRSGLYDLVVTVEGGSEQPEPEPEPEPGPPFDAPISGNPGVPTDPDGDGRFDDVNGDGQVDFTDVIALAFVDWASLTPAQVEALDFDGNGRVDFADVIELAFV